MAMARSPSVYLSGGLVDGGFSGYVWKIVACRRLGYFSF